MIVVPVVHAHARKRMQVVTTSGGPQDGAAAAAAPDGVHDPGQGVEGAGAKTGAAHHGRLLGAPQDTRAPAQGCDGDEAPKGECVKVSCLRYFCAPEHCQKVSCLRFYCAPEHYLKVSCLRYYCAPEHCQTQSKCMLSATPRRASP